MTKFRGDVQGYPRRTLAALIALLLALSWLVVGVPVALADGPTTFANSAAIAIPASGSANQTGPASPYPSAIAVSGMSGLVTNVAVTFHNLTHAAVNDIDAMVVAPAGENIVVLSDVGDPNAGDPGAQLVTADNINLTFSDSAAGPVPRLFILPSGTYLPSNTGGGDTFPTPAVAPSAETTLAGAFTGISPNGNWQLYVVDDTTGDLGVMAGGWSLTITTETAAVATTTTVVTSDSSSTTGDPVTFTAAIAAGGSPVPAGTVQFSDGGTNLGTPVALGASGEASLTTSALTEGTHQIRATYSGVTGFLASNGTVSQRVDNSTVVTGNTFCNTGPLALPSVGPAQPYPSNINVSGLSGNITKVTATLNGLSHQAPFDLDVLLSGPAPNKNLFLLSDSGGFNPVSNVDVTFDDAATGVPDPLVNGTFQPTNSDDGSSDAMPAPAPAPTSATALSTLNGTSANGQWSLWAVDDASGDSGSISGGWCLTVSTQAATTTTLAVAPNPSTFGAEVTLTATVTSGGSPVTAGGVQFSDGAALLGSPVAVGADGTATFTTSALAVGSHSLKAVYSGTTSLGVSTATATQVVGKVPTVTTLVSGENPSTFGVGVTFTATVLSGLMPISDGTVSFSVDGTVIEAAVDPVAGEATWTTSTLSTGSNTVTAEYSGTDSHAPSSSNGVDQTVNPVADAGGPYTVAEGGSLALDASGSSPGLDYAWDINDDDVFTDAAGVSPTVTWAQLEALGIDDGPASSPIALRVTGGTLTINAVSTTLTVINTAPTAVFSGDLTAIAGTPFTLGVGAEDPSSVDRAAQFTYMIDWGDGTPVETTTGPAVFSATHTYAAPGDVSVSVTATDKDAGESTPASAAVEVGAAPSPSPSPSASPTSGQTDLYSTPGYHEVNGRRWFTSCEAYSQTVRCRTSIWATQVSYSGGAFVTKTGWYFNSLTYLPYMKRTQWADNPLGHTGEWTSTEGREWRTECDTAATGGNGCRSYIRASYIASKFDSRGNRTYYWTNGWVLNSIVRFK